jgi:hypothetical protein
MIPDLKRFSPGLDTCLRIIAGGLLKRIHGGDIARARDLIGKYWIPGPPVAAHAHAHPEGFAPSQAHLARLADASECPFVYESPDEPHLKALREAYGFDRLIAGAADEYEAMIRLATWLGAQWDHGKDPVPGGPIRFDPMAVIDAGSRGSRFWCEIAAKVAVQAFTAMGWPARLVTTSRDGHTWEHALVDVWSNRFGRWVAMDTDFNFLYESEGVPLSAWEICHKGEALQALGKLKVRMLGAPKPSLPMTDLLPFFAYVHIDLRSDWYSRRLPWGSPAGGDLATWWTSRPSLEGLFTPKVRLDDQGRFDWPVNMAWLLPERMEAVPGGRRIKVGLIGYSPFFAGFQISIDEGPWQDAPQTGLETVLAPGRHKLEARLRLANGGTGWSSRLDMEVPSQEGADAQPSSRTGIGSGA